MCPCINPPEHGAVTVHGFMPGSAATYSCLPGFQLQGTVNSQCLSSGTWSHDMPLCVGKYKCFDSCPVNFLWRSIKYSYIFQSVSKLMWQRKSISFVMEEKDILVLHSQYHGCWWPDQVLQENSGSSTRRMTSTVHWCIASKLKVPLIFYGMHNTFLSVDLSLFNQYYSGDIYNDKKTYRILAVLPYKMSAAWLLWDSQWSLASTQWAMSLYFKFRAIYF